MLDFIKFLFKVGLFFISPLIAISIFVVLSKIGWTNIAIVFVLLVIGTIAYYILSTRKIKNSLEEQRYNEYIAGLNRELSRPIIQAKLAKQEEESIHIGGKATFTDKYGETQDLNININLKLK